MKPEELTALKKLRQQQSDALDATDALIDAAEDPSQGAPPTTATRSTRFVQDGRGGFSPDVVDLSLYPGANDTARAVAAYRATVPGADKLDDDTVFELACEAKRTGKFVNLSGRG